MKARPITLRPRRVLALVGTRPEVIKLGPVLSELARRPLEFRVCCVASSQHTTLARASLEAMSLVVDHDLNVMREGQLPHEVCARVVAGVAPILESEQPEWVLVQGDSSTALAGALAGEGAGIAVAHLEAGLRVDDPSRPYPEELNRRLISRIASLHLAPTAENLAHLRAEGVAEERALLTGNPGVDALYAALSSGRVSERTQRLADRHADHRLLLVTLHRREMRGRELEARLEALRVFTADHADVRLIYPVHLNPAVRDVARRVLEGAPGVELLEPLTHADFVYLLERAWLVVTDSGGVQEEAATLGRRMIVVRPSTERPEALCRDGSRRIAASLGELAQALEDFAARRSACPIAERSPRAALRSPFGDGRSAKRIADALAKVPPEAVSRLAIGRRDVAGRLEEWLLSDAVQVAGEQPEAGGITGFIEPGRAARVAYGEITGYYLSWLAWVVGRSPEKARRARPRAEAALVWLERHFSGSAPPPTWAGLECEADEWRNSVVFAFDLVAMARGVEASSAWLGRARCGALARRIVGRLAPFFDPGGGLAPFVSRPGVARQAPPDRWSTRDGVFLMKPASWLLKRGLALSLSEEQRRATEITFERGRLALAGGPPSGPLHPTLYGLEGLVRLGSLSSVPASDVAIAARCYRQILARRRADGALPASLGPPGTADDEAVRVDVVAQMLRIGCVLAGRGELGDDLGSLSDIARWLCAAQHATGAMPFSLGSSASTHLNVWSSIFTHQALCLHGSTIGPQGSMEAFGLV